jgi:transcriptional regulator with XRE-family HTH domain
MFLYMHTNNISQDKYQKAIAQKISISRKNAGMTQKDLAEAMFTSQSAIARMEAGDQNFTTQTLSKLQEILGTNILIDLYNTNAIRIEGGKPLTGDVQLQGAKNSALPAIAAALLADKGTTILKNIPDINDMGADILVSRNNVIVVEGVFKLTGGIVRADDIRAGVGLVLAGLAAQGETVIENVYQIERGHQHFVERLASLGANISVLNNPN